MCLQLRCFVLTVSNKHRERVSSVSRSRLSIKSYSTFLNDSALCLTNLVLRRFFQVFRDKDCDSEVLAFLEFIFGITIPLLSD